MFHWSVSLPLSFPRLSAFSSFLRLFTHRLSSSLLPSSSLPPLSILSSSLSPHFFLLFFSNRSSVIGILHFSTKTAGSLLKKRSRAMAFKARYVCCTFFFFLASIYLSTVVKGAELICGELLCEN